MCTAAQEDCNRKDPTQSFHNLVIGMAGGITGRLVFIPIAVADRNFHSHLNALIREISVSHIATLAVLLVALALLPLARR